MDITTLKDIENELIKQGVLTQEELNEIKYESKIKFESVNDDLEQSN